MVYQHPFTPPSAKWIILVPVSSFISCANSLPSGPEAPAPDPKSIPVAPPSGHFLIQWQGAFSFICRRGVMISVIARCLILWFTSRKSLCGLGRPLKGSQARMLISAHDQRLRPPGSHCACLAAQFRWRPGPKGHCIINIGHLSFTPGAAIHAQSVLLSRATQT